MPTKSTQTDPIAQLQATVEKLEAEALDATTAALAAEVKLNATQTELQRAKLELQRQQEESARQAREEEISTELKQAREIAAELNQHVAGVIRCYQALRDNYQRLPQIEVWNRFEEMSHKLPVALFRTGEDAISMVPIAEVQMKDSGTYGRQYPEVVEALPQITKRKIAGT